MKSYIIRVVAKLIGDREGIRLQRQSSLPSNNPRRSVQIIAFLFSRPFAGDHSAYAFLPSSEVPWRNAQETRKDF